MSGKFTAKNYQIGKAPKRIVLLGDKAKPEPAQHIIEFPGGAIEVTRTTDGNYWAHIIVNRGQVIDDTQGRESARGQVIGARIGREHPHGLDDLDNLDGIEQIAVLVRSERMP